MLTQKQLKEILNYDPLTGLFHWKIAIGRKTRAGVIAGSVNDEGYIRIIFKGKQYRGHRLAWLYVYGYMPKYLDHINHIRHDNRIDNLRVVTAQENSRNSSMYKNNTSGVTGVGWHKKSKKWMARIKVENTYIYLGCFMDKFEAVCVRKSAENKYGFHENHGR